MKILVINKDKIENIPPLISVALILNDLGCEVHIITGDISESLSKEFNKRGITYEVYGLYGKSNPITKGYQYLKFRSTIGKRIKQITHDLLWIEGANTIYALGNKIKGENYILQISELHNETKPFIRAIDKVIKDAKIVFMPEYNRCVFYQVWFKLPNRPRVLVNKPYFIPSKTSLVEYENKYKNLLEIFKKKKVILYQGWIQPDRDLSQYILATKEMGEDYCFVMIGVDCGMVEKYKKLDNNIIHIDFIPAPEYLVFTANAYIGILSYNGQILNNAYCAPNKIFEYSAFGLPMIGNDIPALISAIQYGKTGCIVDENNKESIKKAITNISNNYTYFSENSKLFNLSIDNKSIIQKALNDCF